MISAVSHALFAGAERAMQSSLLPPWLRTIVMRWLAQTAWLLEFEPSWFAEFGLAVGATLWGVFCFITDDILVEGWAQVLPVAAIILGVVRAAVLLRLWYAARVILTALSAALIGWIWLGLAARYGVIPMMGWLLGAFATEMLTAAKFSLPCARELRGEFLVWRDR